MAPAARVIDYGAFPQPPSPIFRDYVAGRAKVAPFFTEEGRWDLPAIGQAAERAAAQPRAAADLARVLVAQQEARGARPAAERASLLAESGTVAVVTGQQPVLFGGPLYVLYKALATVEIAARLQALRGKPVVPVFWVASDDHDFAEIRSVAVLDDSGALRTLRYAPRQEPTGHPAAAIVLDERIGALVEELGATLPAGDGRDAALARIAEAYRPGVTIVQAFARLLSALLPELVVLDPADPALKRLAAPIVERELRDGSPLSAIVAEAGSSLLAAGYHQQVPVREGLLNAFLLVDGVRHPLGLEGGAVEVRGTGVRLPLAQALQELARAPERWSANALLRPLVQDFLLPTAAYVGGPAEIAYHAQIGAAYPRFGVPRPVIAPRPGVTLLDSTRARVLEQEKLDLPDLQGDAEGLVARWVKQAYPDVESGFAAVNAALVREMGSLTRALAAHDPTLEGAANATTGRMLHPLEGLQEKSMRALKKRDQARADRLRRAHDMLFPGGSFQERGLSLVGMLARYGEALLPGLRQSIDPFAKGHQVVSL